MTDPRTRRFAAFLFALSMLLAACGSATPTASPAGAPSASPAPTAEPSGGAASASPAASQDADAIYDAIESQVVAIRELDAATKVDRETIDEDQLRERLTKDYDKNNDPAYVAANERLYKALGLLPQDADLREMSLELLSGPAGVAGFYDDEEKKMYVVSRSGEIGANEKITYAHEYTHALQDQHFPVFSEFKDVLDQSDRAMGRMGVYEGDATLLMTLWALQHFAPEELAEISQVSPEQQAALDKMPKILSDTLLFPYSTGALFVQQAQMGGGWDAVDAFYDRMPVSTEQIMHPEKYQAGEEPVDVQLPADLAKDLGAGWTVPLYDSFGEFQMGTWLRIGGVAQATAAEAAAGWGGDRLAVIDGPADAWAVVMQTEWDTEADAAEFEAAAETALKTAGGVAQVVPGAGGTTRWIVVGSDDATLTKVAGVLGLAG
jgi:hypothetical protein